MISAVRGRLVRICALAAVALVVSTALIAGDPPRLGYSKVELGYLLIRPNASSPPILTVPNASSPASIANDVPFDILEEYTSTSTYSSWISWVVSVKTDLMDRLRELAPAGMQVLWRGYYDWIYFSPWYWYQLGYDTRLSLPPNTTGLPLANYAETEFGAYAVQFHSPAKPEWSQALRDAGAIYGCDVLFNGVLIGATPPIAAKIADLPFVQWSTPLHPYLKRAPSEFEYGNGVIYGATIWALRLPGTEPLAVAAERLKAPQTSVSCQQGQFDTCTGSWSAAAVAELLQQRNVVEIVGPTLMISPPPPGPPGPPPSYPIPTLAFAAIIALPLVLAMVAIRRIG